MNAETRVVVGWVTPNGRLYMSTEEPKMLDPAASGDMVARSLKTIGAHGRWNPQSVRDLGMLQYHCPSNTITVLSLEPFGTGTRKSVVFPLRKHAGPRAARVEFVMATTARMGDLYSPK